MKIYLDTNAFYFFFFNDKKITPNIKNILKRIHNGETTAVTSCLTLDELTYATLMRLIEKETNNHPKNVLRKDCSILLKFTTKIQEMFQVIYSINNLEIVPADKNIVGSIPSIMEETLLLPRDCIHLRTMRDHNCKHILTTDTDFDKIPDITRLKPENHLR